jgi:hypothetical protein
MGPLFVVIIWAIVAVGVSVISGPILAGVAANLLRGVKTGKAKAVWTAALLPAGGFVYLFVCVIVFSIWSVARGRDMGWGDSWDTPILGSYHIEMIDLTDRATLYERAEASPQRADPGRLDVANGVRRLEVRPPYILGAASPEKFMEYPLQSPETLFFIVDTRTGTEKDEPSLLALQKAAEQLGGPLNLEPVDAVYGHYRYGMIDLVPVTILAVPPIFALFWLMRQLLRLRATREATSTA